MKTFVIPNKKGTNTLCYIHLNIDTITGRVTMQFRNCLSKEFVRDIVVHPEGIKLKEGEQVIMASRYDNYLATLIGYGIVKEPKRWTIYHGVTVPICELDVDETKWIISPAVMTTAEPEVINT